MDTDPNVVKEQPTPAPASDANQPPVVPPAGGANAAPGSKTEPELLLESLKEEREKRRILEEEKKALEEKLNNINPAIPSEDVFSDEGKHLDSKIKSLSDELSSVKGKLSKQEVLESHPELKDMWQEFEKFCQDPENKGMNIKTAAKAFLTEKGVLEPVRKGLEKATGGDRVPQDTGLTAEQVADLRKNNPKKYLAMLQKGELKFK